MVDVDSHWMNAIPSLQVCPPRFGHFFGSMPATNQRKPRIDLAIHRELEFLAAPQDAAWIATPWAFPPGSPILDAFLAKWDCNIGRSRANFIDNMQSMRTSMSSDTCARRTSKRRPRQRRAQCAKRGGSRQHAKRTNRGGPSRAYEQCVHLLTGQAVRKTERQSM